MLILYLQYDGTGLYRFQFVFAGVINQMLHWWIWNFRKASSPKIKKAKKRNHFYCWKAFLNVINALLWGWQAKYFMQSTVKLGEVAKRVEKRGQKRISYLYFSANLFKALTHCEIGTLWLSQQADVHNFPVSFTTG